MASVSGATPKLQIPRWIQLVGLPLLLLFLWTVAGHVKHVAFVFLVAALIALLLNPVVRRLARHAHIPRGIAIAVVYLAFLAAVVAALGGLGTVVVDQTRNAGARIDDYFTQVDRATGVVAADRDVDSFQQWLDDRGLKVDVQTPGHKLVKDVRDKDVGKYTTKAVDFLEGAAISIGRTLFDLVLLIVVSIYMLLDTPRLARTIDRRFPPLPGTRPLMSRMEHALLGYVKGQALLSLIIGASAGLGLWILNAAGLLPGIGSYILLFAAWVAFTELIPYVGPWLGGLPAFVYALVVHPLSAIWVTLLFLFIHQVEGHVVIPNVMSRAVRLHPLLVMFGLLGGFEIYGLAGVFVALPLLAALRAAYEFFSERVELEPWLGTGPVPVEVEVETHPPPAAPPRASVSPLAAEGVEEPPAATGSGD